MSFWGKVRSFFGLPTADDRARQVIRDAIRRTADASAPIIPADLLEWLPLPRDAEAVARHLELLAELVPIEAPRYRRTREGYFPPGVTSSQQRPAATVRPAWGSLDGLGEDEVREEALRRLPWAGSWWIDRSRIPPHDQPLAGVANRLLVLRGHLSADELAELERVGAEHAATRDVAYAARVLASRDAEAAVAEARAARARAREEKRAEAAKRREARRAAIARRRDEDITFLGRLVSGRLHDRRANVEALEAKGLPVLCSPADVARALGVSVSRLRWLCFHAEVAERPHYIYFEIPKRAGGTRLVSTPHAELARAQRWLLDNVLDKLATTEAAHGFVRGRSTLTNARPHVGRDVVVNLDLEAFFPTLTFPRVRGLFAKLGYSPAAATVLALLVTEPPRVSVQGKAGSRKAWVAIGPRSLPQGACTSPALSNQLARRLDARLSGLARALGASYTRYADDLTFGLPPGKRGDIGRLLARVRHLAEAEGFTLNPKKGRVLRKGGRQEVTGVVVNEKPGPPRELVRRLRAILHHAEREGLAAQNRSGHPSFAAHVRGQIAYVSMLDPEKGARLAAALAKAKR